MELYTFWLFPFNFYKFNLFFLWCQKQISLYLPSYFDGWYTMQDSNLQPSGS